MENATVRRPVADYDPELAFGPRPMIFSCSKCGTRHQLPDEQVAHRVLKVRCTGCSAIVIVRDPASAAVTATAWFVAIHGQQRGPLSLDEVAGLVAQGAITPKTYAWRAGLAEWTKVAGIEELKHLVEGMGPGPDTERQPVVPEVAREAAAARHAAEQEASRQAAAAETVRQAAERNAAEAEAARQAAEAEAARQAAEAEAARQAAEAEAARQAAEAEAARQAAEAETARQAAEAEAARQAAEAEAAQQAAEAEAAQQAAELAAAEAEAVRQAAELEAAEAARQVAELEAAEAARHAAELEAAAAAAAAEAAELEAAAAAAAAEAAELEAARQAAAAREKAGGTDDAERRAAIASALVRAVHPRVVATEPPPVPAGMPPLPGAVGAGATATPAPVPEPDVSATAILPFEPGPSEPTGLAGLIDEHELAFFESQSHAAEPAPLQGDDIFASVDRPTADDKEFFKRAMKEAPATPFKDRKPSKIEMNMLRQEFSVVAHLERTKNKSWIYGAIGVGAVVALTVGLLIYQQEKKDSTAHDTALLLDSNPAQVYAERKLYATPPRELPELVVEAADPTEADSAEDPGTAAPAVVRRVHHPARTTQPASKDGDAGLVSRRTTFVADAATPTKQGDAANDRFRSMTPEQFKALTRDDLGKGEMKINFDSHAVQDAAAKEAAAKHEEAENERAVAVAEAFGKKRRQFASCASDSQERVKVVFTVLANGNVSEATIENTRSEAKADCLEKILGRSIFPKGTAPQTYSQTLVL